MFNQGRVDFSNVAGKVFIIPQDPRDHDILGAVDRKTRVDVENRFGIPMQYDWQCNTITNVIMSTLVDMMAQYLRESGGKDVGAQFYDVLLVETSTRKQVKAEKQGNINIVFKAGDRARMWIENGIQYIENDDEIATKLINGTNDFIDRLAIFAARTLSANHGFIFLPEQKIAPILIAYTFIDNLYKELVARMQYEVDTHGDPRVIVLVNFNDIFEMKCTYDEDEGVTMDISRGVMSKLGIKHDGVNDETHGR